MRNAPNYGAYVIFFFLFFNCFPWGNDLVWEREKRWQAIAEDRSLSSVQAQTAIVLLSKWGFETETKMAFLGIDFSCALGSLRDGHLPEKDCLLPLISKLLGYVLVAASTTVKLPQACQFLNSLSFSSLYFSFGSRSSVKSHPSSRHGWSTRHWFQDQVLNLLDYIAL